MPRRRIINLDVQNLSSCFLPHWRFVFYWNGDGTLQSLVPVPMAGGGSAVLVVADFDKDGAPDLAASIPGANRVGVLMNTQ